MNTWALIPIRGFAAAKQRLAGCLTPAQRTTLAEAMAQRVLRRLQAHPGLAGVAVVSPDPAVRRWAEQLGAPAYDDRGVGLNAALSAAAHWLETLGAGSLLIVPADVPDLHPDDVSAILRASEPVLIVPAARDGGTNALRVTPPSLIAFRFGTDSAAAHRRAAANCGAPARCLALPSLAQDIDVAADLAALPEALRAGLLAAA